MQRINESGRVTPAAPRHSLKLFDDFERTDHGLAKRTEAGFPWWNRSARLQIALMRDVVEGWFARYEPKDTVRLRSEFRSKRAPQHIAALFELFVHEHLLRAGFGVQCQIDLPGTRNKPDFLVLQDGIPAFYLEAKTKLDSHDATAIEQRRQEAMEVIRHLRSPDFFVGVTLYGSPMKSVSKGTLKRELVAWLAGLDHEAEVERFRRNPYSRRASHSWKVGDLTLEFNALPRTDSRGADFGPFLATEMRGEAELERTDEQITEAVEEKASRYGDLELPYLIAINLMDFTADTDDVSMGLRAAWGTPEAPTNQGVNGVVLAFVPNMAAAVDLAPVLVINPSAMRPLGSHVSAFRPFTDSIRPRADAPTP